MVIAGTAKARNREPWLAVMAIAKTAVATVPQTMAVIWPRRGASTRSIQVSANQFKQTSKAIPPTNPTVAASACAKLAERQKSAIRFGRCCTSQ